MTYARLKSALAKIADGAPNPVEIAREALRDRRPPPSPPKPVIPEWQTPGGWSAMWSEARKRYAASLARTDGIGRVSAGLGVTQNRARGLAKAGEFWEGCDLYRGRLDG